MANPLCWRQLRYGHFVCGSHACRGAWMRAAVLSGTAGRIRSPGVYSRAATYCENQRFAPVVAWMRAAAPSGVAGWLLALDSFSSAATPRATISRSQPTCGPLLREWVRTLRMTPACAPGLSREVRSKRCAQRRPRTVPLSGGRAPWPCSRQLRVSSLSGGGIQMLCDDSMPASPEGRAGAVKQRQPATPKAERYPPGCQPANTVTVRWTTCKGPGPHVVSSADWMLSDRKEGQSPHLAECLQLRCKPSQPFAPARSFSCLRSARKPRLTVTGRP